MNRRGARARERYAPATLRAAWWAWGALRHARRDLARDGVRTRVQAPPRLPASARRGVEAILRRRSATCLEQCVLLQSWLAAHDMYTDVVVGLPRAPGGSTPAAPTADVPAHAWLALDDSDTLQQQYCEIYRIPAVRHTERSGTTVA